MSWNDLSRAQQKYARQIRDWANAQGAAVTVSQIAKDLDTWAEAHRSGTLPAGNQSDGVSVADLQPLDDVGAGADMAYPLEKLEGARTRNAASS